MAFARPSAAVRRRAPAPTTRRGPSSAGPGSASASPTRPGSSRRGPHAYLGRRSVPVMRGPVRREDLDRRVRVEHDSGCRTRAPRAVSATISPMNVRVMMSSNVKRVRRTSALRPACSTRPRPREHVVKIEKMIQSQMKVACARGHCHTLAFDPRHRFEIAFRGELWLGASASFAIDPRLTGGCHLALDGRLPAVRAGLRPRLAAGEGEAEDRALHGAELLEQRPGVVRQLVLLADRSHARRDLP